MLTGFLTPYVKAGKFSLIAQNPCNAETHLYGKTEISSHRLYDFEQQPTANPFPVMNTGSLQ